MGDYWMGDTRGLPERRTSITKPTATLEDYSQTFVEDVGDLSSLSSLSDVDEELAESPWSSASSDADDVMSMVSIRRYIEPLPEPEAPYTREVPEFFDPECVIYPGPSPYEFSEEEFAKMKHSVFLRSVGLKEPPLLPAYLSSSLLNDSSAKDYKRYPYQYHASPHHDSSWNFQINKLKMLDKSDPSQHTLSKKKEAMPNHVMLNHLITCNLRDEKVMTCSCTHRYGGKFITQIVYFGTDCADGSKG